MYKFKIVDTNRLIDMTNSREEAEYILAEQIILTGNIDNLRIVEVKNDNENQTYTSRD